MQENRQWFKFAVFGMGLWLVSAIFAASTTAPSTVLAVSTTQPAIDYFNHRFWHPIATVTTGIAFAPFAGHSQHFPAQNGIFSFYDYTASAKTQGQLIMGGFIGAEFLLRPTWLLQAGFDYDEPLALTAHGVVTQGVDIASADRYAYHYTVSSHQFLIASKLLYHWQRYYPYVSVGMGAALNNASNYQVNIQPPFTAFSPQFANRTATAFTYSLGFGVDVDITDYARLGAGYRFADLGAVKTGQGTLDTVATRYALSQSHFYLHEIQAQLTFILI